MSLYDKRGNYHKIRGNKGTRTPQRAIFVDSETKHYTVGDTEHHSIDIAWTYYYRKDRHDINNENYWRLFETATGLWGYVESLVTESHPLYIFAHNLFFDIQAMGFFPYFTQRGWEREFNYFDNGNYILVIAQGKRRIKAISTTNYFDFSLKTLGSIVGLDKMDIEFGGSSREELINYCRRDVKILVVAMTQYWEFIRKYDLGNFALTRASQAMNAYRHRFMDTELVVHDDTNVIDLERKAYMGGRVEAYYVGKLAEGDYVSLDINSMYPFVMRNFDYPTRLIDYKENIDIRELEWYIKTFACVAEITLNTDVPAYSIRRNGKLLFPTGAFAAYVTSEGLRLSYQRQHLQTVRRIALYERAPIFRKWVDEIYPLKAKFREDGNQVYAQIVKILMNSLYGKFGQTMPSEETISSPDPKGYWRMNGISLVTGENIVETQIMNRYTQSSGRTTSDKAMYNIAAHVTENARLLLWRIIEQIGIDRVLYVDTDSVKIRMSDINSVTYPIHPTELGALSIESRFRSGHIYGAKDYELDGERKLKGVPERALSIGDNVFTFAFFPGQATHLRMKIEDHYVIKQVTKKLQRNYDKGIVTSSGRVVPFHLQEL